MIKEDIRKSKLNYINTNRLNRKVISNKIAMSWYKCKMNNLMIYDDPKISHVKSKFSFHFDIKSLLQKMAIQNLNFYFIDLEGTVIEKIVYDKSLNLISQFRVENCGTTAAELFISDRETHEVIYEEHYLDYFVDFCSYSLPVRQYDNVIGGLIIFSKEKLPINIIELFNKKINQMTQSVKTEMVEEKETVIASPLMFDNMLWLTEEEQEGLQKQISYVMSTHRPIIIYGPKQSGKRIIAQYIASQFMKSFIIIDALDILPELLDQVYKEAMSHYDTIIITNFEHLSSEIIKLLTVNNYEKRNKKNNQKSSEYKDLNYILTTGLTDSELREKSHIVRRLLDYIGDNTVYAVNTVNRIESLEDAEAYLKRFHYQFTKEYKYKLLELSKQKSISELNEVIKESVVLSTFDSTIGAKSLPDIKEEGIMTLAEIEKQHLLETYEKMEHNMTLTAQVLGIGRSTLYRKLELYQNETKIDEI